MSSATPSTVLSAADLDDKLIGNDPVEDRFTTIIGRLSRLSVEQHFDAYADIDWDAPEMAIDPSDPRWELPAFEPLSQTQWYQSQDPETRARIGLYRIAQMLHTGWQFENILQVGILIFAMRLPKNSPKFRYMYHELVEEGQHSMMFHEFVRRADMPTRGMTRPQKMLVRPVLMAASKWLPMVLFVGALAGEEPADYVQRQQVKLNHPHPLIDRIIRIHVTEEARHISFARHYIRREVPRMGPVRRTTLSIAMPIIMMIGARLMLDDYSNMRREFNIPRKVMRSAYKTPENRKRYADSISKVRSFCGQVGLMGRSGTTAWKLVTRFG